MKQIVFEKDGKKGTGWKDGDRPGSVVANCPECGTAASVSSKAINPDGGCVFACPECELTGQAVLKGFAGA